jgi:SAM-dependent methyltransferase
VFDSFASDLGSRVLEIGCGLGTYTRRMARTATYVYAVDIDCASIAAAQKALALLKNVELQCVDATQAAWPGSFDTAVLLDVIEHLDDDLGMLKSVAAALSPGGRVIVKVPAGRWLMSSLDYAVGHRRRYTRRSVADVMRQAGLTDIRAWPFNFAGVPGWWWNGRVMKRTTPPDAQVQTFDALVPSIRAIEHLFPIPFGLSVFAIGRLPVMSRTAGP